MTLLLEAEHALRARRKKKPSQYHYTLDAPLSTSHPDQVLTFLEWCRLNRISERTGRRILASDNGPAVTQLTPKRIGITEQPPLAAVAGAGVSVLSKSVGARDR